MKLYYVQIPDDPFLEMNVDIKRKKRKFFTPVVQKRNKDLFEFDS